jgi:hypothetical protein
VGSSRDPPSPFRPGMVPPLSEVANHQIRSMLLWWGIGFVLWVLVSSLGFWVAGFWVLCLFLVVLWVLGLLLFFLLLSLAWCHFVYFQCN